jgi:hypothetical protein
LRATHIVSAFLVRRYRGTDTAEAEHFLVRVVHDPLAANGQSDLLRVADREGRLHVEQFAFGKRKRLARAQQRIWSTVGWSIFSAASRSAIAWQ